MAYQQFPDSSYPSADGQPPRKQSPWSSPPVLIAVIAGIVLLGGGVIAALVYTNSSAPSTSTQSSSPTQAPPNTVTFTATAEPTAQQPPQPTATPPSTTNPAATPISVPGADRQGFTSGPRCNVADDDAVFIGLTDRSRVVICQVGTQTGRYYYKGLADGNSVEVSYPTRNGSTFVAANGNVQYVVSPSSLIIRQNGAVVAVEPMTASWVQ